MAAHLLAFAQRLAHSGAVTRDKVNELLDRGFAQESPEMGEALEWLINAADVDFDQEATKRRVRAYLEMPDNGVREFIYKLEKDDPIIDLADVDKVAAFVARDGVPRTTSLRALMLGLPMTMPARTRTSIMAGVPATRPMAEAPVPNRRLTARLDKKPLRVYQMCIDRDSYLFDPKNILPVCPPTLPPYKDVTKAEMAKALTEAEEARRLRLTRLQTQESVESRVCPEDGTTRVRAIHMAVMGADQTGDAYVCQMAEIGQLEGFNVVVRTHASVADRFRERMRAEGLDNVVVVGVEAQGDFWSEDQAELDVGGNVRVPATFDDHQGVMRDVYRDRVRRFYPEADVEGLSWDDLLTEIGDKYTDVRFGVPLAVEYRHTQEAFAAAAVAKGANLRVNDSYIEGGNMLTGTLPSGEGYALVGRDSIATTRVLLRRDLNREVSEEEVFRAIADDLGIAPHNIVPVEQPGDFHIDMWMVPIKPGEVLVDDAREAAELYCRWRLDDYTNEEPKHPRTGASAEAIERYEQDHKFWKEMHDDVLETNTMIRESAEKRARYEERVVRDLEAAGLKVHRMAGVFAVRHTTNMNFMNAEQGSNERGERFFIALGGDPRAEKYVVHRLQQIDTGIDRVYFTDRSLTQTTLTAKGGMSCRAKSEGDLAV